MPDSASPRHGGTPPMFTPFTLRGMTVTNRVVMSPMCMYTAEEGMVNDFHLVHLGSRAMGGAGLVISEMTDVAPDGRISPGCAGIYRTEHVAAWRRITDFVHTHTDAKIGLQLGHAGRKGSQYKSWEGKNKPLAQGGWEIVAPSAIPFTDGCAVPRAMTRADMDRVRDAFAAGAARAAEAGFDFLELHCAHGYLLSTFISPLANRRDDEYGGDLMGRMRFPLEVLAAVRAAWGEDRPLGARISATDWAEGGTTADDAVAIGRLLKEAGLDIVDVSTGNVTDDARPPADGLYQTPFSERVRNEAGIATMTVGNIRSAEEIDAIVAEGRADLCAVGKGHLWDPYFARHAARALGYDGLDWPPQYRAAGVYQPA
jgi:anthraniloyl-CoA monooxygenase